MQRKVFRIEQMFGDRMMAQATTGVVDRASDAKAHFAADATIQKLKNELALLHDAIVRNKRELAALIGDGQERRMARTAGELGAAVEGMEKATVMILKSTEMIDDSAKALAASLKTDFERGLSQDIQDRK